MSAERATRAIPSSAAVSRFMQRMRRSGTGPELAVRRSLHRRGLRFRVNMAELPGRPDIVLTRAKIAIFVDGCFWHGCPVHAVTPKANEAFWTAKITSNKARDKRVDTQLRSLGWSVRRVWEHEDPETVADVIARDWRQTTSSRDR